MGLTVLKGSIAALGGKSDQTDFSSRRTGHDTVCLLWLETLFLLAHSVQQEPQCSWVSLQGAVSIPERYFYLQCPAERELKCLAPAHQDQNEGAISSSLVLHCAGQMGSTKEQQWQVPPSCKG